MNPFMMLLDSIMYQIKLAKFFEQLAVIGILSDFLDFRSEIIRLLLTVNKLLRSTYRLLCCGQ